MFYKDAICIALEKDSMRSVFIYLRTNRFKSKLEKQFAADVESVCGKQLEGGNDE